MENKKIEELEREKLNLIKEINESIIESNFLIRQVEIDTERIEQLSKLNMKKLELLL